VNNPEAEVEGAAPMPGLVDTHCHLFLMDGAPADLVARARAESVVGMVCCGVDPETSARSRDLADSLAGVFASAGVHPHSAAGFDAAAGATVEELLADPRVVAVGETGLDHHRMLSPAGEQERVFRLHCALSRETGKPLVVHTRDAWPDVLRVLGEEHAEQVVLHCFSGGRPEAAEAAARGYFCSFAGNVTYPQNAHLREAAASLPAELLLTETDSPFLAPQAVRGSDNVPGNVRHVVRALAEARGEDPASLAGVTAANAHRAFGLPHPA
jgi:TatD DNase family protein